jgi:hypothetical protein
LFSSCPPLNHPELQRTERTISSGSSLSPSLVNSYECGKERFQCQPGECIFATFVCDGEVDCSEGEDEKDCMIFTDLFEVEAGFKLQVFKFSS